MTHTRQKVTYERIVQEETVTETLYFSNADYLKLSSKWKLDENVTRGVFSGEYKRKKRGWYLELTFTYDAIGNDPLFDIRNLFDISTENILYYPDENSDEHYEMDGPDELSMVDLNESYQEGVEVKLRSSKRYANPIAHDIGYWGCRKINFGYHIRFNGSEE